MKVEFSVKNNLSPVVKNVIRKTPDRTYKAVAKSGGIVKKGAALNAPSRRISTSLKVVMGKEDGAPVSRTGFKRMSKGWYGKFSESGTKRHVIKPKKKKILAWPAETGKAVFGKGKKVSAYYRKSSGGYTTDKGEAAFVFAGKKVNHPGMAAKPFLKPAFEKNLPKIKQTLEDAVVSTFKESKR